MYMPLLNEGTDAWRPIEVTALAGAVYRVEGPMPADEEWKFAPGTIVTCGWKKFSDGEQRLIPIGDASPRSTFADYYKRVAGMALGVLPVAAAIEWLPRAPEGHTEPAPMFVTSAGLVLVSMFCLARFKPRSLIGKSTLWSGTGFGLLMCLVSFLHGL